MIILTAYGGYFVLSGKVSNVTGSNFTFCKKPCLFPAGSATEKMVMSAYELNNFIFILARVPQIWSNYKASSRWNSHAGRIPV